MRPNIVLITADQWRGDCLGVAGHPVVRTPHVDALASEATTFARHYAQASPCGPSRACLYTGLYQMTNRVVRNGTPLDGRHDNIALALRRAGYDPTLFGYTDQAIDPRTTSGDDPWLRSYEGILPGFSVRLRLPEDVGPWLSWLKARGHEVPSDPWQMYLPQGSPGDRPTSAPSRYSQDETETAFLTDEFLRWLDEQHSELRAGKPWCAHISFLRPHPPFVVPEPFNTMYDPAEGPDFIRAETLEAERASHPLVDYWIGGQKRSQHYVIGAGDGLVCDWTEADFRQLRATYWGMISEVDRQIGRIVAGLKARGDWDNTLFVLTSDHGEMMGDHWTLGKFGFHEQSYHVPLIIRDPARPESFGACVEGFSESVDIFPTLMAAAGLDAPAHLDGCSLVPALEGLPSPRDAVFWEYDFREVASGAAQDALGLEMDACSMAVVRTERWKYVHFAALPPLLFDLRDDPGELVNLAADPAHAETRIAMAERLLSWRAKHLDRRLSGIELTPDGLVDGRGRAHSERQVVPGYSRFAPRCVSKDAISQ
ncbi:alkaline phosphatase family protein [Breoghania sp. L-A4]|uniref:alkaline phosphatase family protein n=1 Tax=Breoghania sp. L-A4 TaxID=2304600 RepID=UPI000E358769|nr:alkaline phosphatase family protein [Breoghania sp. L-A4]AXS39327.1 phosphonate monoester hydrolase [Breoghania sp. L-A4]